jgi:hypothetical protein
MRYWSFFCTVGLVLELGDHHRYFTFDRGAKRTGVADT